MSQSTINWLNIKKHNLCNDTTDNFMVDLNEQYGVLYISGTEAARFLQGQLTNNIMSVNQYLSQLSAWCSPKGRVLVIFHIIKQNDGYLLLLPTELLPEIQKRLQMFVLMSKVSIEDVSRHYQLIFLKGKKSTDILAQQCDTLPQKNWQLVSQTGFHCIKPAFMEDSFLLITRAENAVQLITPWLSQMIRFQPGYYWQKVQILAGIPVVYQATSEQFVPQMLNLHILEGISFKKGCYTGQEVVARMHYLGKLKRQMFRIEVPIAHQLCPGDALYSPLSNSAQGAGKIVSVVQGEHFSQALAVLENEIIQSRQIFIDKKHQYPATILDLPYQMRTQTE